MDTGCVFRTSQIRTVRSREAVASQVPSGLIATETTPSRCPVKMAVQAPVDPGRDGPPGPAGFLLLSAARPGRGGPVAADERPQVVLSFSPAHRLADLDVLAVDV